MAPGIAIILILLMSQSASGAPKCLTRPAKLVSSLPIGSYVTQTKYSGSSTGVKFKMHLFSHVVNKKDLHITPDKNTNCKNLPLCIDEKTGIVTTTKYFMTVMHKAGSKLTVYTSCVESNGNALTSFFIVEMICPFQHMYPFFQWESLSSCLKHSYAAPAEMKISNQSLTFVSDGSLHLFSYIEMDYRILPKSAGYDSTYTVTVTSKRIRDVVKVPENHQPRQGGDSRLYFRREQFAFSAFSVFSVDSDQKIIIPLDWPVYDDGDLFVDVSLFEMKVPKLDHGPKSEALTSIPSKEGSVSLNTKTPLGSLPKIQDQRNGSHSKSVFVPTSPARTRTNAPFSASVTATSPRTSIVKNADLKRMAAGDETKTTRIPYTRNTHAKTTVPSTTAKELDLATKVFIPLNYDWVKVVGFELRKICGDSDCVDSYWKVHEESYRYPKLSDNCKCCEPMAGIHQRCKVRNINPGFRIKPPSLIPRLLDYATIACSLPLQYLGSDIHWLKDGKKAVFGKGAEVYSMANNGLKSLTVAFEVNQPQQQGYYQCAASNFYQYKVYSSRVLLLIKDLSYVKFIYNLTKSEDESSVDGNQLKQRLIKEINESFRQNGIDSSRKFAVKDTNSSYEIDVSFIDISKDHQIQMCKKMKHIKRTLLGSSLKTISFDCCEPSLREDLPSALLNSSIITHRRLNNTFKHVIRNKCVWNSTDGAQWTVEDTILTRTSYTLQELVNMPLTEENALEASKNLVDLTKKSKQANEAAADVEKSVDVMEKIVATNISNPQVAKDLLEVTSNIMDFNTMTVAKSQRQFSTSGRIVKLLETISEQIELKNDSLKMESKNIALLVFKVAEKNPPSIVIKASNDTDGHSRISRNNVGDGMHFERSASIFLNSSTIKMAAGLKITDELRVSSFVFRNSKLFLPPPSVQILAKAKSLQSYYNRGSSRTRMRYAVVDSKIISASFKGIRLKDLPPAEEIEIDFQALGNVEGRRSCVFWDFSAADGRGNWSSKGCYSKGFVNGYLKCRCNHLTNFAMLVSIEESSQLLSKSEKRSLSYVTYIGCTISLFFLLLTFLTYAAFRNLRKKQPSQILMLLCISLIMLLTSFLAATRARDRLSCSVFAILIHYFLLTSFCWMAVEGVNLYLCLVKIMKSRISRFMLRCNLFAWGIPAIIVAVTAGVTKLRSYGKRVDDQWICILTGLPFHVTSLLPMILIMAINLVILALVLKSLGEASAVSKSSQLSSIAKARIAVGCSLLMGLTWTVGLFAIGELTYMFQLIFCALNSLQGLFIFIMYCGRHGDVRSEWSKALGLEASFSGSGPRSSRRMSKESRTTRLDSKSRRSRSGSDLPKSKKKSADVEDLLVTKPYDGAMLINNKKVDVTLPGDDAMIVLLNREQLTTFKGGTKL